MDTPTPPPEINPLDKLNARQRKFVVEYLNCLNGSEAARRANYSVKTADRIAYENLRKPEIKAAISYLGEEMMMSSGEAVQRMTNWGRGTLEHFVDEQGVISITTDSARQHLTQVKKYKRRKEVRTAEDGSWTSETITEEIELYDAKDAVDKVLQLHGRYKQLPGDAGQPKPLSVYVLPDGTQLAF